MERTGGSVANALSWFQVARIVMNALEKEEVIEVIFNPTNEAREFAGKCLVAGHFDHVIRISHFHDWVRREGTNPCRTRMTINALGLADQIGAFIDELYRHTDVVWAQAEAPAPRG